MSAALEAQLIEKLGLPSALKILSTKALERTWSDLCAAGVQRLRDHGRFSTWVEAVDSLELPAEIAIELDRACPRAQGTSRDLKSALQTLGPWKKGPFELFGTCIDAEWRSDLKWARVLALASSFHERRVLDVGTGNGYFLLRAAGAGAHFTLGLEPSAHYVAQYLAINRCFRCPSIALLPATSSEFTQDCAAFDTVLSMGVLYHRRSPMDHLMELKGFLKPGGELILETIVVPGESGYSLVPEGRYAQMRNVWFLPSVGTVEAWLRRLGFKDIRSGDAVTTTNQEQRTTEWTRQPSLADFLDPHDSAKTIEGHPAPARVITVARRP